MFEPITFILGIAESVLTDIVVELITGKIQAIGKPQIKEEISNCLAKKIEEKAGEKKQEHPKFKPKWEVEELILFQQKVMDEIEILSSRYSNLVVSSERIYLKDRLSKSFFESKENFLKKELSVCLGELNKVIAQRRKEIELVSKNTSNKLSPANFNESEAQEKASIMWKSSDFSSQKTSKWEKGILEMEDRIRQRRLGEDTLHE